MFEGVDRMRNFAPAEDQFGAHQLVERLVQFLLRQPSNGIQKFVMNSRPATAPIWATSRTGDNRSRRAVSDACNVVGIANGGRGPSSTYAPFRSRNNPPSSTIFVSSSMNRGTPSV